MRIETLILGEALRQRLGRSGLASALARCAAPLAALALLLCASPARAVILPAQTIDGPSEDIVGFGGIAMAQDGSGGLVYLKRVAGVPHVFVSRYVAGRWLAPIRVDTEQPFAASWPRIGAADNGELVIVWATPYATEANAPVDELYGATLGAGASGFGPAQLIDPDIREAAGTSPDLAMSSTGYADLVYRVVSNEEQTNRRILEFPRLRPGDVVEEVRVAHFDGERWSALGAINRDAGVSMRPPTEANAPKIAIGQTGNGVVVWQEPEINGVARIWARRLFGGTLDYVLPVTATSYNGAPIGDDADAPSVAISRLGQAEVAYRQNVGHGSPLPGPRIYLNTLPDGESGSGAQFTGPSIVDSGVSGGAGATVGPPSIDMDEQRALRLVYDANGTPRVIEGNDQGALSPALSLGPPFAGAEPAAASVMDPVGGGVSAWQSADGAGHPAVAVRENFADGAVQTALVGGGAGGPIGGLAVGRSGLGDGLIGFLQGPLGNAAIVADEASAPPTELILSVPKGWLKPSQAAVSWQPATSADGPLTYRPVLDGHPLATTGAMRARLDAHRLGSGRHRVQLLASDIAGGSALSAPSTLLIDAQPPAVAISRALRGKGVQVRVTDAYSGVDKRVVSVNFGDGHSARGRVRYVHRYARVGIYRVSVYVRSKLGNAGVVRQLVSVR